MARISNVPYDDEDVPTPKACSVCGAKEVAAYWRAVNDIAICRECAIDVLPKLAADAMMAGNLQCKGEWIITHLNHSLVAMGMNFYKAAAHNFHRALQDRIRGDQSGGPLP